MNVIDEITKISAGGERVTHLFPNGCYMAHLSIYKFAVPFIKNARVLDVGSGSGYGAAYLAGNGAAFVEGIDSSADAVEFSKRYYTMKNLSFRVMDLQSSHAFADNSFDVIFSSNTFEHIPRVYRTLRSVGNLLKNSGVFILAVPPVTDEQSRKVNVSNPYHLHIWTPRQWRYALGLFFKDIQPYSHFFNKPGVSPDYAAPPEKTGFNENDFVFEKISIEDMYRVHSMTAVFIARDPRAENEIPEDTDNIPAQDDSFSRPMQNTRVGRQVPARTRKARETPDGIHKNPLARILGKIKRPFKWV